ncbi:MAG: PAS domain S-box protein [Saprospiraceae bacterium]
MSAQLRLTNLIANMQAGILVEDENRLIVLTNERFCKKFNIPAPPSALVGMDCSNSAEQSKHLFKDPEKFVVDINELLEKKEICVGELLELVDGRIFKRDYIPITANGHYLGHLWQYQDVTQAIKSEELLKRSEEKYRRILENMELGLMEVDIDGIIERVYDRFCEMTGYTEKELIGKYANDILLPKEYLPVMKRQHKDRLEGKAGNYEIEVICKGGERKWVLISGTPIYDHAGRMTGSLGIHYDLSKQKELQQQLFKARLKAEEAQEAEKQFLANMSHEIRTPLNAIIGMTHLLYDTNPTSDQANYLEVLKHSSEILRSLINDLLDIAKMRAGKLETSVKRFDLPGLVRTIGKTFQLKLDYKAVEVVAEIDPQIDTLLHGDDLLLNQILLNLMGNAEKFTNEGKIGIRVFQKSRDHEKVNLLFEVFDSGIGIPEDKIDLIFQNFRQVDGDIKRRYGGTGLGLYIVKELVDVQGGKIWVDSQLGKGTVFSFELTYLDSGEPISDRVVENQLFQADFSGGYKVLIVEDNSMNRRYLSSLLDKWNIKYDMAVNGRQGVEKAHEFRYDLIFMDIQMPEMDGYEATIAIRSTANPNKETPIVALTASAMLSKKDKTFQVGMDDYVSKPFTPVCLLEVIKKFLDGGKISFEEHNIETASDAPTSQFQYSDQLDAQTLFDLYGNDAAYALDMFNAFFEKIETEYPQLRSSFEQEDYPKLGKLAHRIKPTFPMVGLSVFEEYFQQLEDLAKSENVNVEELETYLGIIEKGLDSKRSVLEAERNRLEGLVNPL